MKRLENTTGGQNGFTLLEIIVTLVAAGILAAFFFHFMGTALDRSWRTVEIVRDEADGESTLEQIIADYVERLNSDPANALATMVTKNGNGDYGANVSMQYIGFDAAGHEIAPTSNDTLKVTIQATGNQLVTLLTKSRDTNYALMRY